MRDVEPIISPGKTLLAASAPLVVAPPATPHCTYTTCSYTLSTTTPLSLSPPPSRKSIQQRSSQHQNECRSPGNKYSDFSSIVPGRIPGPTALFETLYAWTHRPPSIRVLQLCPISSRRSSSSVTTAISLSAVNNHATQFKNLRFVKLEGNRRLTMDTSEDPVVVSDDLTMPTEPILAPRRPHSSRSYREITPRPISTRSVHTLPADPPSSYSSSAIPSSLYPQAPRPISPHLMPLPQSPSKSSFRSRISFLRKPPPAKPSTPPPRRVRRRWSKLWKTLKRGFWRSSSSKGLIPGKGKEKARSSGEIGSVVETLPAIEVEEVDDYTVRLTLDIRRATGEYTDAYRPSTSAASYQREPIQPPTMQQSPVTDSSASVSLFTTPTASPSAPAPSISTLPSSIDPSNADLGCVEEKPSDETVNVPKSNEATPSIPPAIPPPEDVPVVQEEQKADVTDQTNGFDCPEDPPGLEEAVLSSNEEELDYPPTPHLPHASLPNNTMPELVPATPTESMHPQSPGYKRSQTIPAPPAKPPPNPQSKLLARKHSRWRGNQTLKHEIGIRIYEERCHSIEFVLAYAETTHYSLDDPLEEHPETESEEDEGDGWRDDWVEDITARGKDAETETGHVDEPAAQPVGAEHLHMPDSVPLNPVQPILT